MTAIAQLEPAAGWRTPGYARVPPLTAEQANVPQRLLLRTIHHVGKLDASNLWGVLMHNTSLLAGFLSFAPRLMPFGGLARQDTELVILRVSWNCRCHYEWGQHVVIGLNAGLTPADIGRIAEGADAQGWSRQQTALLHAVDEIHHERMGSEATWLRLTEFFKPRLLLELLLLIGFYEGLAGVLNSVGLALDTSVTKQIAQLTSNTASL